MWDGKKFVTLYPRWPPSDLRGIGLGLSHLLIAAFAASRDWLDSVWIRLAASQHFGSRLKHRTHYGVRSLPDDLRRKYFDYLRIAVFKRDPRTVLSNFGPKPSFKGSTSF